MLYHLIAIVAAAMAVVWGFRRGIARQMPAVIGVALGIISSRLLYPGLVRILYEAFPGLRGGPQQTFVYDTMATAIVFLSVFLIFRTLTSFLSKVLGNRDRPITDNIAGAIFALLQWAIIVSITFNLLVCINPDSSLVRAARSDDGNISLEVMRVAPALLGGENIDDLALRIQLEEAKKISRNLNKDCVDNVILITDDVILTTTIENYKI